MIVVRHLDVIVSASPFFHTLSALILVNRKISSLTILFLVNEKNIFVNEIQKNEKLLLSPYSSDCDVQHTPERILASSVTSVGEQLCVSIML